MRRYRPARGPKPSRLRAMIAADGGAGSALVEALPRRFSSVAHVGGALAARCALSAPGRRSMAFVVRFRAWSKSSRRLCSRVDSTGFIAPPIGDSSFSGLICRCEYRAALYGAERLGWTVSGVTDSWSQVAVTEMPILHVVVDRGWDRPCRMGGERSSSGGASIG